MEAGQIEAGQIEAGQIEAGQIEAGQIEAGQIEAGAVFAWSDDGRPMRVLMHDHAAGVVMYDAWWPHIRNWGMADLEKVRRQRFSYYVTAAATVQRKARYVRAEPLTGDETVMHRPDLPFAVTQCAEIRWPAEPPDENSFAERLKTADCLDASDITKLDAPEVYLIPFGPKGGRKGATRVTAADVAAFTAREIIWKAVVVQAPWIGHATPVNGIGIYRAGLVRGLPSYYLWGSQSKLSG